MASTRSSKRTASEALAPAAAPATIDDTTTSFPSELHNVEGSSADATLSHKAKKAATDATVAAKSMAADASVAIKGAVNTAIEATTAAAASAKAFVEKKIENQSSTTTVTKPPYAMEATEPTTLKSTEPTMMEKAKLAAAHAGESIVAAAKTVESSVEHASQSLVQKVQSGELMANMKAGANTMAASVSSAASQLTASASQLTASLSHKSGSEVSSRDSGIDTTLQPKDLQVSDASHSKEKADGSLPMERNADEFATNKAFETRADSQLKEGHSGLGTDSSIDKVESMQPGASSKLQDVPLNKSEQPDLLTGDNAQLTV